MMSVMRIAAVVAVVAMIPACATVTRGTKQKFAIESQPPGAAVALSTGQTCTTPCSLKLPRKHGFTARFTMDGYQPAEAEVESKFSGGGAAAGAGNVLIGGIIGAAVDGSNGSLNSLYPGSLNMTLKPAAPAANVTAAAGPIG